MIMIHTLNSLMRDGGIGVFYVRDDSSVIECNIEAQNLLKATNAIQILGGKLSVSDPIKSKEFALRVKIKSKQSGKESILIKRNENRFPIKLSLFPVKENILCQGTRGGKLLVILAEDTGKNGKFLAASFAEHYQLTNAEVSLATSLYRNKSLKKHSDERGIKISTTRWTLDNLFSKTYTRSQLELSRLIKLFSE